MGIYTGVRVPLISAVMVWAMIQYLLLPMYDSYIMPVLSHPPVLLMRLRELTVKYFLYDPLVDHYQLKSLLSALLGYWSIAIITTTM